MIRKLLLQKICPNACINDCRFIGCSQCNMKLNEWLDDYDNQIRADAIDEFARKLYKGCNEMIKQTWGSNTAPISWAEAYADFKVDIEEIAEELKEQKCGIH